MTKIAIILGSTRPGRFGIQPAEWITNYAKEKFGDKAEFELVDVQSFNLPLLDEPMPPMMGQYTQEHTKNWAAKINEFDGYVMVTAEYNHSVPAAMKNAIDFLYAEWGYKPVSFVSYGAAGGGIRAVQHLRTVTSQLRMYNIQEGLHLFNYFTNLDDKGQYKFDEANEQAATALLDQTIFWAEHMKPGREALAAAQPVKH